MLQEGLQRERQTMQPITDVQTLFRYQRAIRTFTDAEVPDALVHQVLTAAIHSCPSQKLEALHKFDFFSISSSGWVSGLLHLPTRHGEEVFDHAPCHLGSAGLRCGPLSVSGITVPGTPGPAASIGGLQTDC